MKIKIKKQFVFVLVMIAWFAFAPWASTLASAELSVQEIVSQVSQTSYTDYLDNMLYTHLGDDRGFGPEHDLARSAIYSQFSSFGLSTSLDSFSYSSDTYYNVVGTHVGTVRPDDIYIIGAHYDSADNPGADDNASGTAAVMEAARVLSQYEFEATLVFIGFDREEQGLYGSKAYAQGHKDDNILGMISVDMIAYNGSGLNKASIYGRDSSDPLKQLLADAISLYGNGLSSENFARLDSSDHAPFEAEGFQASLLIEYDSRNNPYYHTSNDSVDTANYIDYVYATNMVNSTVGFLATAAMPIPEPVTILILGLGAACMRRRS